MNKNLPKKIQARVSLPNLPILALACFSLGLVFNIAFASTYDKQAEDLQNIVNSRLENNQSLFQSSGEISKINEVNLQKTISKHQDLGKITSNAISKADSAKYKAHINRLFKSISPTLDLEQMEEAYKEKQHKHLDQLMIFVSSSMPKEALIQYSIQSKKAGAVLVLRGLINNSFKQTTSFIYSLNKQGTMAIIDPLSYRNFNITQIPQIVVIADNHGCKWGRCQHTPKHDKIQGNITLEYALEQIIDKGEFTKKEASRFLKNLRGAL